VGRTATPLGPSASLVGLWEYIHAPRTARTTPSLNAGLQVSLEIDSATPDHFSGSVARWFAGDVGVKPSNFGRVTGRIDGSAITLTIPFAHSNAAPIAITARRVADDTLEIVTASRTVEPGARFVRTRRGSPSAPP
jgi:hypothetical protein